MNNKYLININFYFFKYIFLNFIFNVDMSPMQTSVDIARNQDSRPKAEL